MVQAIYFDRSKYKLDEENIPNLEHKKGIIHWDLVGERGGIKFRSEKDFLEFIYYMRFIKKYTTTEMAEILNTSCRSPQRYLKELGWQRNMKEAQQNLVDRGRRNYKEIRRKGRLTTLNTIASNNLLGGSEKQQAAKIILKTKLEGLISNKIILVADNDYTILEDREIDIVILIINMQSWDIEFKAGIEYQGYAWHGKDQLSLRENIKAKRIREKSMNYYEIYENKNYSISNIEKQIDNILEDINQKVA